MTPHTTNAATVMSELSPSDHQARTDPIARRGTEGTAHPEHNKRSPRIRKHSADDDAHSPLPMTIAQENPSRPKSSRRDFLQALFRSTIIVVYVSLWITYYLLTHASTRSKNAMDDLNPAVLVVAVESAKFLASAGMYSLQESILELRNFFRSKELPTLLRKYFPVAALYGVYNNLMIANLRAVDPTTFLVLSSSRLLMTSFLWQWVFGEKIPRSRKIALGLITVGVIMKDANELFDGSPTAARSRAFAERAIRAGFILCQMLCGALASVYTEKNLKSEHHLQLQSMCLYIDSIFFNVVLATLNFDSTEKKFSVLRDLGVLCSGYPMGIALNLTAIGIVTSFLLRYVNSVAKAVASASEVIFTTVLGHILFDIQVTPNIVLSVSFVAVGTALYAVQSEDFGAQPVTAAISALRQALKSTTSGDCAAGQTLHRHST